VKNAADIATAKRALRQDCQGRRATAAAHAPDAGNALADTFFDAIAGHSVDLPAATVVASYWPIRGEIDPRPLMRRLHDAGHACALGVVHDRAAPLRFLAWRPGMALEPGGFGVMVPPPQAGELVPAIVLTPLLAFDVRGHRLGYGGGYYDRTLTGLRRQVGGVLAVGLAFEAQRIEAVPHTPRDARLDWVVTEARARRTA